MTIDCGPVYCMHIVKDCVWYKDCILYNNYIYIYIYSICGCTTCILILYIILNINIIIIINVCTYIIIHWISQLGKYMYSATCLVTWSACTPG